MTDRQLYTYKSLINILFLGGRIGNGSEPGPVVVNLKLFELYFKVGGFRGFWEELVKELVCGHRPNDVPFDIMRVSLLLVLGARRQAVDTLSMDAWGGGSRFGGKGFRAAHGYHRWETAALRFGEGGFGAVGMAAGGGLIANRTGGWVAPGSLRSSVGISRGIKIGHSDSSSVHTYSGESLLLAPQGRWPIMSKIDA